MAGEIEARPEEPDQPTCPEPERPEEHDSKGWGNPVAIGKWSLAGEGLSLSVPEPPEGGNYLTVACESRSDGSLTYTITDQDGRVMGTGDLRAIDSPPVSAPSLAPSGITSREDMERYARDCFRRSLRAVEPEPPPLRYDLRQAGPSIRTDVGLDGTVTRTRHDHNGTVVERIVHGRDGAVIERPTLVAKVGAGPEPEVVGEEEEGSFSIDGFLQCEIGGVRYRCSPPLLTIAGERIRRADITRGGRTVGLMVNGKRHDLVPETKAETLDEPDQPTCLDDHPLYGRKK
jgi:hypothetical protein